MLTGLKQRPETGIPAFHALFYLAAFREGETTAKRQNHWGPSGFFDYT